MVSLGLGVDVVFDPPAVPAFEQGPPTAPDLVLVPVAGPEGPPGPAGGSTFTATGLQPGQFYGVDSAGNTIGFTHQLAYAADLSGAATAIPTNGTAGYINGCAITVPITSRSVSLKWGGSLQVTAAGAGLLGLQVYETTSGAAVTVAGATLTGSFTTGSGSAFPSVPVAQFDLGPTTTERSFVLAGVMIRDTSSTLAASVRSSSSGTVRAWLEAVAQ